MPTRVSQQDSDNEVDAFIRRDIDSVPHLEALLHLWNNRSRVHGVEDMARTLFIDHDQTAGVLDDLAGLTLLVRENAGYRYAGSPERDRLMTAVDLTYRRELVRVTRMIHSKGSQAARAFSRAFRFTKDRE